MAAVASNSSGDGVFARPHPQSSTSTTTSRGRGRGGVGRGRGLTPTGAPNQASSNSSSGVRQFIPSGGTFNNTSSNYGDNADLGASTHTANYAEDTKMCLEFLEHFKDDDDNLKYRAIIDKVMKREEVIINIELDDLNTYGTEQVEEGSRFQELIHDINENTNRYIDIFSNAVDLLSPLTSTVFNSEDGLDVITQQRLQKAIKERRAGNNALSNNHLINQPVSISTILSSTDNSTDPIYELKDLPKQLVRRYELHILPQSFRREKIKSVRDLKSSSIGKLVTTRGIVTRVTDVKPLVVVLTYNCEACGHEIYQEINSRSFMPLFECISPECKSANPSAKSYKRGRLIPSTRGSKFIKFQEIKIQELAEHVPIGHIPRALTVLAKGELTRKCGPGDIVTIDGIFLPTPYTGRLGVKAGLIADTYLEALNIEQHKKNYSDFQIPRSVFDEIESGTGADMYTKLSQSIAPEIFGLEDVKKILLLLMIGAPKKSLPDGLNIRGDMHVCIMGDPGVAKSQLLRSIASLSFRGIYTSGKGSSGVGLTAAVIKDNNTGELVLEGGSLVLSDMGICCIDEFDKMEETDRTAIHEVMEQQSISIAKAGITTSLNTRTSILAAANPAYGRYNPKKSAAENINLPPALLSRFDILWLLMDVADYESDIKLARHVTYVHMNLNHPPLNFTPFPANFIRAYISLAKKFNPVIPKALTEYIVSAYVNMRKNEWETTSSATSSHQHNGEYTTARTLLSILRISLSLARLRRGDEVSERDVDEALRLLHMSKASLTQNTVTNKPIDVKSAIYTIIRDMHTAKNGKNPTNSKNTPIMYDEVNTKMIMNGFTEKQLKETLNEYEQLNVLSYNQASNQITFL